MEMGSKMIARLILLVFLGLFMLLLVKLVVRYLYT